MDKEEKIAISLDKMAKKLSKKFAQEPVFPKEDGYNVCLNSVFKSLKKYNKNRGNFFGFVRQCMMSDLIHESINTKGFRISRSLFEKKNKKLLEEINKTIADIVYLDTNSDMGATGHLTYDGNINEIETNDIIDSVLDKEEQMIIKGKIFENRTSKELGEMAHIPVYKVKEIYEGAIKKLSSYYKENNLWPKTI